MPRWFFWVAGSAVAIALLLPYAPVKYALFALFGAIFLSFYQSAPERTLFLFLLGMPIIDLVPPSLFPVPGVNAETILIFALALAIPASTRRQAEPQLPNPLLRPILYFVVVIVVSAVSSYFQGTDDAGDLLAFAKNQVAFMFLAVIAFRLIHTKEQLRSALHLIAITCTLVGVQAMWSVRSNILRGFMLERNRAAGLVAGQPNLFGGFLAMMILVYVSLLLGKTSSRWERLGYTITLGAMSAALLLTLSRGSWVALLLGLGVLALLRGARAIAFVLAIAFSAPLWIPESAIERVQHTTGGHFSSEDQALEDSAQTRLDQWVALPEILKEAPILGHGLRTFPGIWSHYSRDREPKAAHSTWVEILTEEGVVGILGYIWLVGALASAGFRAWRVKDGGLVNDLGLGFMCAILCLMVLDTSGTRFRNREVMAYIWTIGGALARQVSETRRVPAAVRERSEPRPSLRGDTARIVR